MSSKINNILYISTAVQSMNKKPIRMTEEYYREMDYCTFTLQSRNQH